MHFVYSIVFAFLCLLPPSAHAQPQVDSLALRQLIDFSRETQTDEFLLLHEGRVVYHWQNVYCDSTHYHTASMVKSWTGLVVGMLIDRGVIASEDEPVCRYLPDWADGCRHDITIRQLLTMSAGINRRSGAAGILAETDIRAYALGVHMDTLPDISFAYSNESVQLLGLLIERVTGKRAGEVFREWLFAPLGMSDTRLGQDAVGNDIVFGGAVTTVADAAKIGLLMANKGRYDGQQVVSSSWIERSLTPSRLAPYYGYLWWLDHNDTHPNFAAMGDYGQLIIVFPEQELVFVRRQSCNKATSGNMRWMGPKFLAMVAGVVKGS